MKFNLLSKMSIQLVIFIPPFTLTGFSGAHGSIHLIYGNAGLNCFANCPQPAGVSPSPCIKITRAFSFPEAISISILLFFFIEFVFEKTKNKDNITMTIGINNSFKPMLMVVINARIAGLELLYYNNYTTSSTQFI